MVIQLSLLATASLLVSIYNVSVLPDVTGVSFYVNKNYVGQVLSIYSETDELPSEIVKVTITSDSGEAAL